MSSEPVWVCSCCLSLYYSQSLHRAPHSVFTDITCVTKKTAAGVFKDTRAVLEDIRPCCWVSPALCQGLVVLFVLHCCCSLQPHPSTASSGLIRCRSRVSQLKLTLWLSSAGAMISHQAAETYRYASAPSCKHSSLPLIRHRERTEKYNEKPADSFVN